MFDYLNVRVYDDEKTNLLKHWDNTFKYITRARQQGSKVLVHCKMGVSRSASVVIAYAMKAYNLNFGQALKHVKKKRNCIKPNKSFLTQLETYQGMLVAMKNKEKLQRSKSETNLRNVKDARLLPGSEPTPLIQALNAAEKLQLTVTDREFKKLKRRPKSWSPDHVEATVLLPKQQSQSLENLTPERKEEKTKNFLLPCSNGQNYSVSQNQVVHLQENYSTVPSVKLIVSELENIKAQQASQQMSSRATVTATTIATTTTTTTTIATQKDSLSGSIRKETWDPGEVSAVAGKNMSLNKNPVCDIAYSGGVEARISSTSSSLAQNSPSTKTSNINFRLRDTKSTKSNGTKEGDLFSVQLDQVFDREEKKQIRHSTIISTQPTSTMDIPHMVATTGSSASASSSSLVSRQSSFSSVDSAVGLGYAGDHRDIPSRHSSWGSGDNRVTPSRNSSWGSYDIRHSNSSAYPSAYPIKMNAEQMTLGQSGVFPYEKEEIPWHPGTVKRTKQKIENTANIANKRICSGSSGGTPVLSGGAEAPAGDTMISTDNNIIESAINNINLVPGNNKPTRKHFFNLQPTCKNRCNSEETLSQIERHSTETTLLLLSNRLSASAPETSSIGCSNANRNLNNFMRTQPPLYKTRHQIRARMCFPPSSFDDDAQKFSGASPIGPSELSASFNCQNSYGIVQNLKMNFEPKKENAKKVKSLPSSPIATHPDKCSDQNFLKFNENTSPNAEEINVKNLVGKYEITKSTTPSTINAAIVPLSSFSTAVQQQQQSSSSSSASSLSSSASSFSAATATLKPRPRSVFEPRQHITNLSNKPLMITHSTKIDEFRRPPVPPTVKNTLGTTIPIAAAGVLLASSKNVAACKRVQQHGKTHPLSRLGLPKQRLNTATYNTM